MPSWLKSRVLRPHFLCALALASWFSVPAVAQESETAAEKTEAAETPDSEKPANEAGEAETLAGHSFHGEAFNDGPRQKAYLMEGTGNVSFPATSSHERVQALINQGVGQLHGFWYFEAERTFRQAAALDPECAIAYWGMAQANINNSKRAKGFIEEAVKLKAKASLREQKYIDAFNEYLAADPKKNKERDEKYTKALEQICYDFPDDIEAKALLGLQLWQNRRSGLPLLSHLAVDALLNEVLAQNPMHPCHHYRIHLWDYQKAENALNSAALCGQSAPGIAHMWHMPGHIYSRLKRYEDAAWQQEASARVDHAHMMRDRVLPDQIHNFAHNNEWLIRNLIHLGRSESAISLAKNMIELPRHPRYNTLEKRGSTYYGRERLFQALTQFELWPQLIELAGTPYLEPTDRDEDQLKRLRHLGQAYYRSGDLESGQMILEDLQARLDSKTIERDKAVAEAEQKAREEFQKKAAEKAAAETPASEESKATETTEQTGSDAPSAADSCDDEPKKTEEKSPEQKAVEKAAEEAKKKFTRIISQIERARDEVDGHREVANGNFAEGLKKLKKAGGVDAAYLARVRFQSGEQDKALEDLQKHVGSHENELIPLGTQVELLIQADRKDDAAKAFDQLCTVAGTADSNLPIIDRLNLIAQKLGKPADWRTPRPAANDVGDRPDLDSLGPFRWTPSAAPAFDLVDHEQQHFTLEQYRGKPVVVIFYLGYGCLHCAEQLQAFAPKAVDFKAQGIELIAISTDTPEDLRKSHENYRDGKFPFPLVADHDLEIFKKYRVHDDFENQPLHGTFLIDELGQVRWQDISYEPFNNPDFVLEEARRLLGQSAVRVADQQIRPEEAAAVTEVPAVVGD